MTFEEAAELFRQFRDERDWRQFHTPKDVALSISLEAAELLELFQWSGEALDVPERREQMAQELADVLFYCVAFADATGIDIPEAMANKMVLNRRKYPVDKARGSAAKYNEL
ncbi:MAG: nucleotide pyrophosphohydrolase [Coriobacteriaceae bacterium]|nr:nucleotide pyrophosphohydrolase [Coriobacteriaceae bacterium]